MMAHSRVGPLRGSHFDDCLSCLSLRAQRALEGTLMQLGELAKVCKSPPCIPTDICTASLRGFCRWRLQTYVLMCLICIYYSICIYVYTYVCVLFTYVYIYV